MTKTISVSDIVGQLTARSEHLCRHLLPEGCREGAEWRCGSVQGEAGKSLGVRLTGAKTGVWSDFEDGSSGERPDDDIARDAFDAVEDFEEIALDESIPDSNPVLEQQGYRFVEGVNGESGNQIEARGIEGDETTIDVEIRRATGGQRDVAGAHTGPDEIEELLAFRGSLVGG